MKNFTKYIVSGALALIASAGFTACQDDFDTPEAKMPVATLKANTSILELKEAMWADSLNYCHEVGLKADGSHFIIEGRVISNDAAGNLYRTFYIADESAAIAISYNSYDICLYYQPGQSVVIDATGLFVGKYNGMIEFGAPKWDTSRLYTTTSFQTPRFFDEHAELNGWPEPAAIDTLTLKTKPGSAKEDLLRYQGLLVRFNNCYFTNGGTETLVDEYQSSGYSQTLNLADGTNIDVRTSGYCDFWNVMLPEGNGDVAGILGYYNNGSSGGWQLLLIDAEGMMNFGNPTVVGDKDHPYTVAQAIELAGSGVTERGWVKGHIVGTVAPEVTEVKSNSDITWSAPFIMSNTLVIAEEADCHDWAKCLVLELPEASTLWAAGNLVDNPDLLGREMGIEGRFAALLGMAGVTGFEGNSSDFWIEGVEVPETPGSTIPTGNGSETSPYNPVQVSGLGNPGTTAWVKGYIVGSAPGVSADTFTTATGSDASNTNVFIAANPDETDYSKCVPVQLPTGAIRSALSLQAHPENLGKVVTVFGSLEKYFGLPGVKSPTTFTLEGGSSDTPVDPTPSGSGDGSETNPYSVAAVISLGNPATTSWVKGYIVGSAPGVSADTFTNATGSDASNTNIFIADSPTETDYTKCVPVQLPAGNVRIALSLQAHPENLGKEVTLLGSLEKYFGQPGVKSTSEFHLASSGDPTPSEADGSESKPYSVEQAIALNNPGTEAWVEGVIVGFVDGSVFDLGAVFSAEGAKATNVIIAPAAGIEDLARCMPVQLPSGDIRAKVNLKDNPANLGKTVKVKGTLTQGYGSNPALMNATAATL